MKRAPFVSKSFAALLFTCLCALIVFGCGGGGGSNGAQTSSTNTDSGNNGSTSSGVINVALYAFYNGTNAPAGSPPNGSANTLALAVGDQVQFEFIGVSTTTNQPVMVNGSFSTNVSSSVGTLSNGVLTVNGVSSSGAYHVAGTYQGKTTTYSFTSVSAEPRVKGVLIGSDGTPIDAAPVRFYSNSGSLVGQTTTGFDGSFAADLPMTATQYVVDLSTLKTYFDEYAYNGKNYAASVSGCYTPLPKLTTGSTTSLTGSVVAYVYNQTIRPPLPADAVRKSRSNCITSMNALHLFPAAWHNIAR